MTLVLFGKARLLADCIESVKIIQPETATEGTGPRIEVRVREKFKDQIAPLQNHPIGIVPTFSEAQGFIELGRFLEIA